MSHTILKRSLLLLILPLVMLGLSGCSKTETEEVPEKSETELLVEKMSEQYGALVDWFSDANYTIDLQSQIAKTGTLIVFENSYPEDIWEDNGKKFVSFEHWESDAVIVLEFKDNKLLDAVNNINDPDTSCTNDMVVVAKITSIVKPSLAIDGSYDSTEDIVEFEYGAPENRIYKGELIDVGLATSYCD